MFKKVLIHTRRSMKLIILTLKALKFQQANMQYSQPTLAVLPAMFSQNSEREYLIVGFLIQNMNRLMITKWKFTTFIPKTKRINGTMKFGSQLNS